MLNSLLTYVAKTRRLYNFCAHVTKTSLEVHQHTETETGSRPRLHSNETDKTDGAHGANYLTSKYTKSRFDRFRSPVTTRKSFQESLLAD